MIGRRNIVRAKVLAEWATKDYPMPDKDFSYKGVDLLVMLRCCRWRLCCARAQHDRCVAAEFTRLGHLEGA